MLKCTPLLEMSAVESWKLLDKFGEKAELPVVIRAEGPGYPAANLKYYVCDSDFKCALDNLHHFPQERVQQSWWLTAQQQVFSCSVTWSITPPRWTSPGTMGKNFKLRTPTATTNAPTGYRQETEKADNNNPTIGR